MRLDIKPSYNRDLRRVRNGNVKQRLLRKIEEIGSASNIAEVTNVLKMEGYDSHYRIRVGKYRLGIALEDDVVVLIRFRPRRDFYRYFP